MECPFIVHVRANAKPAETLVWTHNRAAVTVRHGIDNSRPVI
jgi:hypothetical protein